MQNQIIAAADGSALGNPGPAGWAWYIDENHWAAGGWEHGTNNMGEIKAVLDLFEATAHRAESKLLIYCDSQYVINSLTQWMPGWKKRGWKKADGKPVQNRDLLEALDAASTGRDYEMVWVKGHAGHELNEAADSRANAAAQAFKEGREPETGPGFPGSPRTTGEQSAPSAQAAQTRETENHAHAQDPDTLAADAHLSLEDFTETEVERARQGFDSLKLNGILKSASAIAAPDTWQNLADNFIAYFRGLLKNPDRLRFCRIFNQHGRIPALEKLYRDYTALWQAQSREAVTRGKENGELRKEADPEYLHFYLSMIISGLIELCLEQPAHPHLGEYCERAIRDSIAWIKAR